MADGADGRAWQIGVWNRISDIYRTQIDPRFEPVVDGVIRRAALRPGERVLDLGTGTGTVAAKAAASVAPDGEVLAIDISADMLALARERLREAGLRDVRVEEAGAESIPAPDASFDAVLASLSLMYVIDRASAAREITRVLRPGGRLVAAVWAGADTCDIVRFQQTAGSFAPAPPVAGVGPGALADPSSFVEQLEALDAGVETEVLDFEFPDFELAWEVLAGVTTAHLPAERREAAKAAVQGAMWQDPRKPRVFRNATQFIVGVRVAT